MLTKGPSYGVCTASCFTNPSGQFKPRDIVLQNNGSWAVKYVVVYQQYSATNYLPYASLEKNKRYIIALFISITM